MGSEDDKNRNYAYGGDIGYSFETFFDSYQFSLVRWAHIVGILALKAEDAILEKAKAAGGNTSRTSSAHTDEVCRNLLSVWQDHGGHALKFYEALPKDGWFTSPARDIRVGLIKRSVNKKAKRGE